VKAVDKR